MTHASLADKIKLLPEDCLDEIDNYIDYVLFKTKNKKEQNSSNNISKYFGSISINKDGLAIQKALRDEWN